MEHSFDVNIAKKYGIEEAILLKNFYFWIKRNACNGNNCFDGKYWTFNKMETFVKLFPYLTLKQVRRVLENLKDKGLLETGTYNKSKFDRTLWYTLTAKGFALFGDKLPEAPKNNNEEIPEKAVPNAQMGSGEMPEKAVPNAQMGRPIPDINTDSRPNINTHTTRACESKPKPTLQPIPFEAPAKTEQKKRIAMAGNNPPLTDSETKTAYEWFMHFWEVYPRKENQVEARLAWMRLPFDVKLYAEIIAKVGEWRRNRRNWQTEGGRYVPMPENFIANERWKDEVTTAPALDFDKPMDIVTMAGMIGNEVRRQQGDYRQGRAGCVGCVEGSRADTAQSSRPGAISANDEIDVAAIWTP